MIQQSYSCAYIWRKLLIQKDGSTPTVIAALFTLAKTWKQLKCPLTDERIKMWYIYTKKYYSAIKKNEIIPSAVTWMDPEMIILSKSDREEQLSHGTTHMWNLIFKKWYKWTYLHNRNRLTGFEDKPVVTKGEMYREVGRDKSGTSITGSVNTFAFASTSVLVLCIIHTHMHPVSDSV